MINTTTSPITSPAAAIWYSQRTGQPCDTTFSYKNESITIHGRRFEDCPQIVRDEYADDSCDTGYLKTESSWLWYFQYGGEWYSHEYQYALTSIAYNAIDNIENPERYTEF